MHQTKACLAVVLLVIVAICAAAQTSIKRANPTYINPTSGQELFQNHCASCHGRQMDGNGPAATFLRGHPSDLTMITKRNNGKFPTISVIEIIRGHDVDPWHADMPSWQRVYTHMYKYSGLEQVAINNLTTYIESHQQ